ncbi:hypothetical protein HanPSC8_Chr05g0199761 [Helianthus annuus]|nr:hypothetical protein HanPSC8_Chr05g0199761 [Helianthus annuus]
MHQVESALKMQGKKPMVLYKLRGLIYKGKMFCHNPPSGYHIPIFEKGYEKDPAIVAKEAIQEATRNGSDVVLSGSHAGIVHSFISYISISDHLNRMYFYIILRHSQDNEPLMRALSKLIYVNSPDLRSCTFCRGSIGPTTISPILVV